MPDAAIDSSYVMFPIMTSAVPEAGTLAVPEPPVQLASYRGNLPTIAAFWKALEPNVTDREAADAKTTRANAVQPWKALSWIVVTVLGMVMDGRLVQLRKTA